MGHEISCCSGQENLVLKVIDVSNLKSPRTNKLIKKQIELNDPKSKPSDESVLNNNNDEKTFTVIPKTQSSTDLKEYSNQISLQNQESSIERTVYHHPKKNQTEKFDLKKLMPASKISTSTIAESSKISLRPSNTMKYGKSKSMRKTIEIINTILNEKQLALINNLIFKDSELLQQIDESTKNMIINCVDYLRITKDQKIFDMELNSEDYLYIIEKGSIEMMMDDQSYELTKKTLIQTKTIRANAKKYFTLIAKERVYLFKLSCDKYDSICHDYMERITEEKIEQLKHMYLFTNIDRNLLKQLSDKIKRNKYENRTTLVKEDEDNVNKMYYVIEGSVLCVKNDFIMKKILQGAIVLEIPFFNKIKSLYTYVAEKGTELYEIPYEVFGSVLGNTPRQKVTQNIFSNAIMSSEILGKYFSGETIYSLFKLFKSKYITDDIVLSKLQKKLIILIGGSLYKQALGENYDSGNNNFSNEVGKKGEMFMDAILLNDANFKHEIYSDECFVLEGQWEEITKIIKYSSKKNVFFYNQLNLIRNYALMSHLSEAKLFKLVESMKIIKFKDKTLILADGPLSDKLYFIKKGYVSVIVDKMEIKLLEPEKTFGDISKKPGSYLIKANFYAKGSTECYYIEKETFAEILDHGLLNPFEKMLKRQEVNVSLENLYYIKDLGQGSYGKVYLVHDKKAKYAMKTAEIQAMIQNKASAQFYLSEKSIMSSLYHPFIVQIFNTYKTREYIFFLLEYVNGMTMRQYFEIRTQDKIRNLQEVQFYAGILGTILDYLESKRIIHRDIKPDNLIIDYDHYVKAIDFGIAKDMTGKDSTTTIIGTVQYLAPEIALGKKYSFPIDYWAVGVVLYEYFYGKVPFDTKSNDPFKIFKETENIKPLLPFCEKNETFNDFIKQLLVASPSKRIHSFVKYKNHSFFEGFDFDKLLKREIKAPILSVNFPEETEKETDNTTYPFHQFMKNHIFCSSAELDQLLKKTLADDFLDAF